MEIRPKETLQQPIEAKAYQLRLLRMGLYDRAYPGYPALLDRLVADPTALALDPNGQVILPDGPWTLDVHNNRWDAETEPSLTVQEALRRQGRQLDSRGRPLHPWINDMMSDPSIGVVTGKGAYWHWGPNRTVDSIIIKSGHILLIKRKDTGNWALPGGFIDGRETVFEAAVREVAEETGIALPPSSFERKVYEGLVIDIRVTANAWPETTALLFQLDDLCIVADPHAADDAVDATWVPIEKAQHDNWLFGAHRYLLQTAICNNS